MILYLVYFLGWFSADILVRKLLPEAWGTLKCNCQNPWKYLSCVSKEAGKEGLAEQKNFDFSVLPALPQCNSSVIGGDAPALQATRGFGATASIAVTCFLSAKRRHTQTECQHILLSSCLFSSSLSQIIVSISLVWFQISCWTLKMLYVGSRIHDLPRLVSRFLWHTLKKLNITRQKSIFRRFWIW